MTTFNNVNNALRIALLALVSIEASCGVSCPPGADCGDEAATCTCPGGAVCCDECACGVGRTCCDAQCVLTDASDDHCGTCGNVCDVDESCDVGYCAPVDCFCECDCTYGYWPLSYDHAGACTSEDTCAQACFQSTGVDWGVTGSCHEEFSN